MPPRGSFRRRCAGVTLSSARTAIRTAIRTGIPKRGSRSFFFCLPFFFCQFLPSVSIFSSVSARISFRSAVSQAEKATASLA